MYDSLVKSKPIEVLVDFEVAPQKTLRGIPQICRLQAKTRWRIRIVKQVFKVIRSVGLSIKVQLLAPNS